MILAIYITTFLIGWTLLSTIGAVLLMSRNRIERRQKREWESLHPEMSWHRRFVQ